MTTALDLLAGVTIDTAQLVDLIAASLHHSATQQRTRYLAIYELTMEATRRPELQQALAAVADSALDFTLRQHRALGLTTTRDQVRDLIDLFGATLFTLVTATTADALTLDAIRPRAQAIVTAALNTSPA